MKVGVFNIDGQVNVFSSLKSEQCRTMCTVAIAFGNIVGRDRATPDSDFKLSDADKGIKLMN